MIDPRCFGDKGDVEDITEGEPDSQREPSRLSPNYCPLTVISPLSADIISTVEFDHTGNYLATGDKGGRVVLFERNETVRFQRTAYAPSLGFPLELRHA
jgi:serine/threonine-protein phosphatase 2A regulatory subunit B